MAEDLILEQRLALGDTVVMTALIRDIHRAYPGRFNIGVSSNWKPVWANNPHIQIPTKDHRKSMRRVPIQYRDGITQAGRGRKIHFLAWYHTDFEKKTGLRVPVTEPKGDLHLSAQEATSPLVSGRYWVMMAGGKSDITVKHWSYDSYQAVVDILRVYGIRVVHCGAAHTGHVHTKLNGVLDLIGQTDNVRDFLNVLKHAEGVICPVTAAMHISACFDKPCIVINGSREEPWWEGYVNAYEAFGPGSSPVKVEHRFLHTLDLLHCGCRKGCWKKLVVPLTREHTKNNKRRIELCKEPRRLPSGQAVAACMEMITPQHVVDAVLSYYAQGVLPPM